METFLRLAALGAFCGAAIYTDLKYGKVPNRLNLAGLACGLGVSSAFGGTMGAADAAAGALLGASFLIVPFLLHMVGGGDVKFMAAAGALVGWEPLWLSFLVGAALGGLAGAAVIIARGRSDGKLRRRLWLSQVTVRGVGPPVGSETKIPYSVPLSVGLVAVATIRLLG